MLYRPGQHPRLGWLICVAYWGRARLQGSTAVRMLAN